jgi:hypothetical protein
MTASEVLLITFLGFLFWSAVLLVLFGGDR